LYLKSLELVGFKSFANRTKLEFDPGMTAIVGPNGCGKSNISDAVRWVLGEQSAKALRGANMVDCIFNGTESHKPLGQAEVTLTLTECEEALGTDFHEVMITRRVSRTGEGQYFVNKTPCRLKDIQRLFMDTGVGTDSYSLLEQGKIDMILSARPDDRREVFEEASGITKFKADKKEAIRKLEHTEANLLRLADIIREVKRQIISLQRQAGKAKRYKTLQEKLRGFDIYVTRDRLGSLESQIQTLETRLASITEQEEALRTDAEKLELDAAQNRVEMAATEKQIADAMENSVQARTELDRARELIQINEDRIRELKHLAERDTKDADEARAHLEQHNESLKQLQVELETAIVIRDKAEQELNQHAEELKEKDQQVETLRKLSHDLGAESVDLESRIAKLQNELYALEAQERTSVIRKERLAAEEAELQRSVETYQARQTEMDQTLQGLREEVSTFEQQVSDLVNQRENRHQTMTDLQQKKADTDAQIAAKHAQIDLFSDDQAGEEAFPGGAKILLDQQAEIEIDRSIILGSLAEQLDTDAPYRTASEAVLRAWLDAVIITDAAFARDLLKELERIAKGSARILTLRNATPAPEAFMDGPGERLVDHVHCPDELRPLIERLLHNVRVVKTLDELPSPVPENTVYVTLNGAVLRGTGSIEYWMPESGEMNPLTRQHQLADWKNELEELARTRKEIEDNMCVLTSDEKTFDEELTKARVDLEEKRRALAQHEGESNIVSQEAKQALERAETVAWELKVLKEQQDTGGDRQGNIREQVNQARSRHAEVRAEMAKTTDELRFADQARAEKSTEATDYRVRFAERRQQVDHLATRKEPLEARVRELDALLKNRADGINSYQARISDLEKTIQDTKARLEPLQEDVSRHNENLEKAKQIRTEKMEAIASCDELLRTKRAALDAAREQKSHVDVEVAEQRIRRQNVIDRVAAEYHITPEQMLSEPEPEWEEGKAPDKETLETTVAEIRTKLEAMGPVNLVAIEEHRELEERYSFLTQQQDDLVKAKQQLMDMIREINKTTTEMFRDTFEKVNKNFQEMFKKLFGGGSAKLVLVNDEDVLDSGIEIIARPPGKKLQTVSLLSGGERTMTAVALLFSLYMVKPSPFCLLDELDAALDEANIGRFIEVVKNFIQKSQFIVITHNRRTISAAEALYGVTMEQNGVSKIVSMKFSHHEKPNQETANAPS